MPNSLTVILPVLDVAGCRSELERQRHALERGWAQVPGLISACLAILPAAAAPEPVLPGLLFECSFESGLAELMSASFKASGQELGAVLGHCADYPKAADAPQFAAYLGSRARRSSAFAPDSSPRTAPELALRAWRVLDALFIARAAPTPPSNEEEREKRRAAVAMQEPIPGVPLVHVSWLLPASRARVKRALRALDHEPAAAPHDARFLLDGARLVFLAYPSHNAQRWSERLSRAALGPCARVWRNSRGFVRRWVGRRAIRERQLQQFVLEHRVPVAAWFNARAPIAARDARRAG